MTCERFGHLVIRASAGSGKTHQLTNRYLGLLAAGVEPHAILATTFTRKAAGEILDRVLERLAQAAGTTEQAGELAQQIQAPALTREDFAALFRSVVGSLHRVRIGTLDSFYIALAGSFSLELGLPPGWTICDEVDDDALKRDALEQLLEHEPNAIHRLLPLLTKGETKRSVHDNLHEVIAAQYEGYRGSKRAAWESLHVPPRVAPAERVAVLERLRAFDFSGCRHKGFLTAQTKDVASFEREDWLGFIAGGLAKRISAGETTYYNKQIPPEACAIYEVLIRHARSEVLRRLAEQTAATWELLDRFHHELWKLKQTTGALYFGDVTQSLVDAIEAQALRAESLAFRLDGSVEHLLLDEFQDTALAQWRVLKPIAQRITRERTDPPRSFFCVGDVKQAIYGWRGGIAEIFNTLETSLGPLQQSLLVESRRSAQPIIDVVNQVFGGLGSVDFGDKRRDGVSAWAKRFEQHTTAKKNEPGYFCLRTGPEQPEDADIHEQRGRHCAYVAEEIQSVVRDVPGRSVGVLCRKKDTVARMIYELRKRGVEASEEAGSPLTDSPAVEVLLSLFTLADHPGHTIAWFHLKTSPLETHFRTFADPDACAHELRLDLVTDGYGEFTHDWARRLAAACDERDLSRLQQLVEMAYAYQDRSTLRPQDFVAWVRGQKVVDPSAANVRVMTIHAAKGLQFDVVVLPECETALTGQTPSLVVGRDSLEVTFVCRYADQSVQEQLKPEERRAFDQDRQQDVEESLSLLYVAMTRAAHALHIYIPGRRKKNPKDAWYNVLLQTLAPDAEWDEKQMLAERGDPRWFTRIPTGAEAPAAREPQSAVPLEFRAAGAERRRGLEFFAPSGREGKAQVNLDQLFRASEIKGTAAGTLYHAWFATIGWLDDAVPTEAILRGVAMKMRTELPAEIWGKLDEMLGRFHKWIEHPVIRGVLCRSAYADPTQAGFPAGLARIWTGALRPGSVEQERRFVVHDDKKFWNGSLDRVVWIVDGERTVAADVLDYKTDAIPGTDEAIAARTEHYRPQLEAYRRAVACLARIPEECIATRLVFTLAGGDPRVVAV
jgi:ATP-dependent exoDNAse (exonuclease V) beta subunit